jgi:Ser-tRNA(Ala) deacylase AlaX
VTELRGFHRHLHLLQEVCERILTAVCTPHRFDQEGSFQMEEMLVIMHALEKFRQYLVGAQFVVKSDHNSLKYFLEQKDLNERQQK